MARSDLRFQKSADATGSVFCRTELVQCLEKVGLCTFSDWMSLEGVSYREVSMRPKRPVVAIQVEGLPEDLYLKRHLEPARPESPLQWLGLKAPRTEARKEVEKVQGFRAAGIPCPEVVAWGEGLWEDNPTASFIATKDLQAPPMERYLYHHWKRPVTAEEAADKRSLVGELACLTRRMHRAGWVHRDFYLGHIFVREADSDPEGRLAVIDVQRADRRPRWWIRSRLKDLASLHFSADPEYIRWADRLRFLRTYWGTERFSWVQRFLIAWILRKARRIRKHTEKRLGIPYSDYFKNKYY